MAAPPFALRYQGRKRVHHADDMMARITAERLAQHLQPSGYRRDHVLFGVLLP
jgi:hypothetical protein